VKFWNQEHFAARLRGMMYIRRVTQKELARALKLNQGTISRWQRSSSNSPSLDLLAAAADFLKVDPGWLAYGTEETQPRLKKIEALELESRLRSRNPKKKRKK
jgi:transcriptional regulator with XRE-family HTH domain